MHTVKICHSDWFNKEPTGQKLGRKGLGGRARLRECWEEGEWSHHPDAEEAEDEYAVMKKRYRYVVEHR